MFNILKSNIDFDSIYIYIYNNVMEYYILY